MDNHHETTSPADPRIAFFDRLADEWDDSEHDSMETIGRIEQHTELLDLQSGHRLLEVGCGTGQLTGWLADRVRPGRIVAVDFSQKMLAKAASKGISADFRAADVCRDDLGHGEFDVALCFHSFPHFRDQSAALRNLARCLKSSGRLIVMHLRGRAAINTFHQGVGGVIATDLLPTDQQWGKWLNSAGLRLTKLIDEAELFFLRADVECGNR
jgi:ubiquinone/menaquinone biosynthesis C-methylase UbiE